MRNSGCHICAEQNVTLLSIYASLPRVTSDCRPWRKGGKLAVCQSCGCVQTVVDSLWHAEAASIYQDYSMFHQSDGAEQAVFQGDMNHSSPRSARLLEHLGRVVQLPKSGRLLDIGCGNGSLFRQFANFAPAWLMVGTDLDAKYRAEVENIAAVDSFWTCDPASVEGTFDLITMVHVLEHIPDPRGFLSNMVLKLTPKSILLINVPDHTQNPFDLVVADHCTHFSVGTISSLLHNAGFEIVSLVTDWIPNEIVVVAKKGRWAPRAATGTAGSSPSLELARRHVLWLKSVVAAAGEAQDVPKFGLFGAAIAATWLFGEVGESVKFFVDEDPNRVGKLLFGRPIYHPGEVPSGSHVFIALQPNLAVVIGNRLARPFVTYHLPPRSL